MRPALSPLEGHGLTGYVDRLAADAGTTLSVMASGPGDRAGVEVLRLRHADPDPRGPGVRVATVDWSSPEHVDLAERPLALGSFLAIGPAPHLTPSGSFTVSVWARPTRHASGWATLAAQWGPGDVRFGLFQVAVGTLTAAVSADGVACTWLTLRAGLALGGWQQLGLAWDAEAGTVTLSRRAGEELEVATGAAPPGPLHASGAPLCFGARSADGTAADAADHFDGKLARPVLVPEAVALDDVAAHPDPLGRWALEAATASAEVPDRSRHGRSGVLHNAPTLAVTGPGWKGRASRRFTDAPGDYDAVHLHSDDLDDALWPPVLELAIPEDAGGVHAARLRNPAGDELVLPFVVRPAAPRAACAVLLPTLTWRAYGGNRRSFTWTDDGVLDTAVALYDLHADGSPVRLVSQHRPTRSGSPFRGFAAWGPHLLTADLYLLDWLEQRGVEHDVLADEHLDADGVDALRPYRCVLLGSHPEYATGRMLDALEAYVRGGGRLMYLAGNGLYWVASLDAGRPHLMEVRKGPPGEFPEDGLPTPGESQHQTTGEDGGTWQARGRPPSRLVGLRFAANAHVPPERDGRFVRTPASYEDRWAWVFARIGDEPFGGAALGLGTAAGYEMDAVPERVPVDLLCTTVHLARAADPSFYGLRLPSGPPAADVALGLAPGGGAVFSAGSIAWTSALSQDEHRGAVATITENVLRRMLETTAGRPIA